MAGTAAVMLGRKATGYNSFKKTTGEGNLRKADGSLGTVRMGQPKHNDQKILDLRAQLERDPNNVMLKARLNSLGGTTKERYEKDPNNALNKGAYLSSPLRKRLDDIDLKRKQRGVDTRSSRKNSGARKYTSAEIAKTRGAAIHVLDRFVRG